MGGCKKKNKEKTNERNIAVFWVLREVSAQKRMSRQKEKLHLVKKKRKVNRKNEEGKKIAIRVKLDGVRNMYNISSINSRTK